MDVARFIAPATSWGDVGSATGPLLVQLALASFARGWAVGRYAAVWASSEGPERAVALIESVDATVDARPFAPLRPGQEPPTALVMAGGRSKSPQDLATLEELVTESAFFYLLRRHHQRRLEREPEHNGAALESIEERLEAHFDGAALALEPALRICAESGEDPGNLYVMTRMLSAAGRTGALMQRLVELDLMQPEIFRAVHDALSHSAGPHAGELIERLVGEDGSLRALGLWLAGDCGLVPKRPWSQLASAPVTLLGASLPWALGRLGSAEQAHQLGPWLESREPEWAEAAAFAYLRLDPVNARRHLHSHRAYPGFMLALSAISEPSEEWISLAKRADEQDARFTTDATTPPRTTSCPPHLL